MVTSQICVLKHGLWGALFFLKNIGGMDFGSIAMFLASNADIKVDLPQYMGQIRNCNRDCWCESLALDKHKPCWVIVSQLFWDGA